MTHFKKHLTTTCSLKEVFMLPAKDKKKHMCTLKKNGRSFSIIFADHALKCLLQK